MAQERILVVDDEAAIREIVCSMLGGVNYVCREARSGVEALALLDSGENFELMLTDLMMDEMDGTQLLERSKEKFPDMPVIMVTAVYDISARAVYLPNGVKLEAHSGLGGLMDNPAYVDRRMVGATPPNIYDLKPREKLFHGVAALRMTPVGENEMHGRTGLLVHSYLLGPNGDSNGCVSIKEYDRFLAAYTNGEVKRLVVVPSLKEGLTASRRSPSPS